MASTTAARALAKITCPRQRAVARRVGEVLDVFSVGFAKMPAEERLAAFVPAGDDAARWRNAVRMAALGMVVRLGRDLGLATNDLHGDERLRGRTQVPELKGVQRTTVLNALRMCDAMLEDRSDLGTTARERYAVIRKAAKMDVANSMSRNKCTCGACHEPDMDVGVSTFVADHGDDRDERRGSKNKLPHGPRRRRAKAAA